LRVAHISDIHISTFDGARWRDFLNKRVLGGLNLLLHRREYTGGKADELLSSLERDVSAQKPDLVLFTGDVTSLSLPQEFEKARTFVNLLGDPSRVVLLPGNHDCYTYEAQKSQRFETVFEDYVGKSEEAFPYVRRFGEKLAIVALSSAVATPPPLATGRLGQGQRDRLKELLKGLSQEGRFVVLAMHHPPDKRFQKSGGRMRHMEDWRDLLKLAADANVPMIAHGHEHRGWQHKVQDPKSGWSCQVFDAGSGTALSSNPERCARYNVYTFDDKNPGLLEARARVYNAEQKCFVDQGAPPQNPNQQASQESPW
jgi:3',5'-cyclic AMP phosphodiesterase CpdA